MDKFLIYERERTYSYIVHVEAVSQVEVADEVAAVVLWISVRCRYTHWTHLEGDINKHMMFTD